MSRFGKVAVLMGGRSAEREISLKSGMAILKALVSAGIDAHAFDPAALPLHDLIEHNYDRAFIALHGRGGEDGQIQGALHWLGVPYTGSGVLPCALAMDKVRTKHVWAANGLPTARSITVHRGDKLDSEELLAQLGGKVMVKPACEGSSIGINPAENAAELVQAIAVAHEYDHEVLLERWLAGPEYTIGILDGKALPVIRLQPARGFYDYAAKYQSGDTQYLCPAGLTEPEELALRELALKAFAAIGGSGWGRIDVMRDAEGTMQLLEANMVPGMTEKSLVPMAAKAVGMDFQTLVLKILAHTEALEGTYLKGIAKD